jgi:hypothetical protein
MLEAIIHVTAFEVIWHTFDFDATNVLELSRGSLDLQCLTKSSKLIVSAIVQHKNLETILWVVQSQRCLYTLDRDICGLLAAGNEYVHRRTLLTTPSCDIKQSKLRPPAGWQKIVNRSQEGTAKVQTFTEQNQQQPRSGQNFNGIFCVEIESRNKVVNLQSDGDDSQEAAQQIVLEQRRLY